jgi:hypothetical protein
MRYNPDTERGINIDEIAAQCRAAIMKADAPAPCAYDEILTFYRWEDDVLRLIPEPDLCAA